MYSVACSVWINRTRYVGEAEKRHAAPGLRSRLSTRVPNLQLHPSSPAVADRLAPSISVHGKAGTGAKAMTGFFAQVLFEPGGPVSVLMKLAEKEAKLEQDKGAEARSPLLQALVQVCSHARRGYCS